eukprot:m.32916 g.32916  ORF g.32916 m.32916 type:complete len:72 (+) comp9819_c1_seq1:214-429(+)
MCAMMSESLQNDIISTSSFNSADKQPTFLLTFFSKPKEIEKLQHEVMSPSCIFLALLFSIALCPFILQSFK